MDDRELLEYIAAKVGQLTQDVEILKNGQKDIITRVTKIEASIENEIKPDIKASLEGYKQVYEKLTEHDHRFDTVENKLEKQDVEIRVIKGGK